MARARSSDNSTNNQSPRNISGTYVRTPPFARQAPWVPGGPTLPEEVRLPERGGWWPHCRPPATRGLQSSARSTQLRRVTLPGDRPAAQREHPAGQERAARLSEANFEQGEKIRTLRAQATWPGGRRLVSGSNGTPACLLRHDFALDRLRADTPDEQKRLQCFPEELLRVLHGHEQVIRLGGLEKAGVGQTPPRAYCRHPSCAGGIRVLRLVSDVKSVFRSCP